MKALIVYASWFGHNRTIARALAAEMSRMGFFVACAPIGRVKPAETMGFDLVVLGTYTHGTHASRRMRAFCDAIPQHRLDRLSIAVFGTQTASRRANGEPCGVDELLHRLAERHAEPVIAPMRIVLRDHEEWHLTSRIGPQDQRDIQNFAAELWEAVVPEPVVG
ncbi:MAG: hypothetical protein OHK0022_05730 [Roseiflexaceae bacterium]